MTPSPARPFKRTCFKKIISNVLINSRVLNVCIKQDDVSVNHKICLLFQSIYFIKLP